MDAPEYTTINAVRSEIVKYSHLENLKNFYKSHPECGSLKEGMFTRHRTLPFGDLLHFTIYPRAKSTDIELLEFSHLIGSDNVNKSDFSRRRQLIPAGYLKSMHRDIVSSIYSCGNVRRWHGRMLLAADGTTYSLPNTHEIEEEYLQGRKTGKGQQALARGIVIKDVLNDIIVGANMECYGRDEIRLLADEMGSLPSGIRDMSPLLVLDRKFCAYTLLALLKRKGWDFIIRVKGRFSPEIDGFMASGETQRDVELVPASTTVKKLRRLYGKDVQCSFPVRLVRLTDNVVVMTSVKDTSLLEADTDPYHARWNDETTIGFLKNNLQVEIFSANLNNSIQQDFHAKTIQYNLLSVLCRRAAEVRHGSMERRINCNIALGILKWNFGIFIRENDDSLNIHLQKALTEMERFTTPVKPDRHNPRVFRKIKHEGKFITLHNYREAI